MNPTIAATKDLFISYGRRESLLFVGYLHQQFKLRGFDGWFDKVNIPDGDDYALRISNGIESAHNFVYIMAPRCMTSPYCLVELEYARVLGKRVIPVAQIPIFDCPPKELSEGDKMVMVNFYKIFGITGIEINTEKDVLDRSHAMLGKTDWVYGRQELSAENIKAIFDWQANYENYWYKHDDVNYLKNFQFPSFGKDIDPIEGVIESVLKLAKKHERYVQKHTELLEKALYWKKNNSAVQHLLVGQERKEAEEWLMTEFIAPEQPPCLPSDLHADFLCQSRKNAENLFTDLFISYPSNLIDLKEKFRKTLAKSLITTWTNTHDIQAGTDYGVAINRGIEQADMLIFFVAPESFSSEYCMAELQYANTLNKKIIPILVKKTDFSLYQDENIKKIAFTQYIDITDNENELDFARDISDLIFQLREESDYFYKNKVFLAQALKWQRSGKNISMLPRGNNLEQAKIWLKMGLSRQVHLPTLLHEDFIKAAEALSGNIGTDVFVSYSRKDGDFARKLNENLQLSGKTTWFDQESIASGSDFQAEINKGIENTDNFLFVITPASVGSPYCKDEVEHAKKFGKRLITILLQPTDLEMIPQALRERQWINFYQADFQKQFLELLRVLDIDREHVAAHTIWQNRAIEWENSQRSHDYLLNASALEKAEAWLKNCYKGNIPQLKAGEEPPKTDKNPPPTSLQISYLCAGREAIALAEAKQIEIAKTLKRRLTYAKIALGVAAVLLFVAVAGFLVGYQQTLVAKENEKIASAKSIEAQKSALEAQKSAVEAKKSAEEAQKERQKTEKALDEVKSAEKGLQAALIVAKTAKDTALVRQKEAEIAQNKAVQQKLLAELATQEAKIAEGKTEEANQKALRNLYWFNAKEFAFKSLETEAYDGENRKIKALLALNSHALVRGAYTKEEKLEYPIETLDALQNAFLNYEQGVKTADNQLIKGEIRAMLIPPDADKIIFAKEKGKLSVGKIMHTFGVFPQISTEKLIDVPQYVRSLTISQDGKSFAGSSNTGEIWLFENENLTILNKKLHQNHQTPAHSVLFLSEKNLLSASLTEIIFWDMATEKARVIPIPAEFGNLRKMADNEQNVYFLCEKGSVLTCSKEKIISAPSFEKYFSATKFSFFSLALSQNQGLFVGTGQGELLFIPFKSPENYYILPSKHTGNITSVQISPDKNWIASGGLDKRVSVWDLRNFNIGKSSIDKLSNFSFELPKLVYTIAFDSQSKYLFVGDAEQMRIRSLDLPTLHQNLKSILAKMPDNQLNNQLWQYYSKGENLVKPVIDYEEK